MRVILTGYNGFVARTIEKKLKEYEFVVVGMPREYLYNLFKMNQFFDTNKPDYIIHTAAYGNMYHQDKDLETISANIYALMNLLEVSRIHPYQGFINFSTSSVLLPHQTMYSASKASGELLINAFVNKYDKPIVTVRPYTIIGRGEQPEHLIPTLIRSAATEIEMPFVEEPVHDFIDVEDVASAVLKIMERTQSLKGMSIDVGTGIQTSNKDVKELVEKITGKTIKTKIVENMRSYDTKDWKADTKVLDLMGWFPKYSLEDSIRNMI